MCVCVKQTINENETHEFELEKGGSYIQGFWGSEEEEKMMWLYYNLK